MNNTKICKKTNQMYSIGEVAKLCNVSRKTLRFYEQLGLLKPDHVSVENGYRYYTEETMNSIPVIKYYKQMGFKLQEMKGVQQTGDYFYQENIFLTKLEELKLEERRILNSYTAVSDWLGLIREGTLASENRIQSVNVKYFEQENYVFLEQEFRHNYMDAVINIPWVNYLEEQNCAITGPVILRFEDCEAGDFQCSKMMIMQKPISIPNPKMPKRMIGGQMFLSSYHIGDLTNLAQQYKKMQSWAKENNYRCKNEVYQRYVIDYWSTMNVDNFVVELLIPAEKIRG
ncbi:MerR family transcriptional regulator [Enterococcus rotai]|uniref:MerR family transcriptional regulator n=1 Tax=Enterococcus rotai TaxID=118060 RepID=UPI0032B31585